MAQLPILPHGSPTTLSGLSETFSFHSSPEHFITSRVLAFQASHPELAQTRAPIQAKVLNRDVAVISSYEQVKQCLSDEETAIRLSSSKAYNELMAPFFPAPNLLLTDPPTHGPMKQSWIARMASLRENSRSLIQELILDHFRRIASGSSVNLYDSMKTLSWRVLLSTFMSLSASEEESQEAATIELLQENLLRGQFSLMPVSVNVGLWQTPRSKGLESRKKLQAQLSARVKDGAKGCPFATTNSQEQNDVANHMLLFTSSLAVKALASLLTAVILNLYIFREDGKTKEQRSLAERVTTILSEAQQDDEVESIILETERLSPPVVGIIRRAIEDIILQPSTGAVNSPATLIPQGWDLWIYFVGAARDPANFGQTAETFLPSRYSNEMRKNIADEGLAFGAGAKSCLGRQMMRDVAMTVAKTCLGITREDTSQKANLGVTISANIHEIPIGVQGWLGWQSKVKPEQWAKDMKQLPTQRPLKPLMVQVVHNLGDTVRAGSLLNS